LAYHSSLEMAFFAWSAAFLWVRCLGSFVGCSLDVFSRFYGLVFGVYVGFSRVSFGSNLYNSCVRRGALCFHFNKLLLTYQKKKKEKKKKKRKRHVIVIDRCCMCKRNGESLDHLLFHCEVARAL